MYIYISNVYYTFCLALAHRSSHCGSAAEFQLVSRSSRKNFTQSRSICCAFHRMTSVDVRRRLL